MSRLCLIMLLGVTTVGCATSPCDRPQPYQQARPKPPLTVPGDLSEPRVVSRAPEAEAGRIIRRSDGRCLEQPPEFIPPSAQNDGN